MAIRFHLDESVSAVIAHGLQARGIDVTLPQDVNLLGASDEEQLAVAYAHERVLVTHDTDFLILHNSGALHEGIIYCHQRKYSSAGIIQLLLLLDACYSPEEMIGRLEYL